MKEKENEKECRELLVSSINNVIERGVEKEEPIFPEPLSLYTVFQYFPAALIHDG